MDRVLQHNTMASKCVCSTLILSSLLISSLISLPLPSHAADTLTSGEHIQDGETLISARAIFELGFFCPGNSTNRYVGIWYYNFSTSTVLWVANRESPVHDRSGKLAIGAYGNLVILDGAQAVVWSSNVSTTTNESMAQLMDNGNLVLNTSAGGGGVAWQSFNYPTDTYLPGMKIGLNMTTNVNQVFTSWRSADDPAPGNFSIGIDPDGSTQIILWEGVEKRWRSGRWNGQVFLGVPNMVPQYIYGFKLSDVEQEHLMYFYYSVFNSSHRYVLSPDGVLHHMIWRNDSNSWSQAWAQPTTDCEVYNKCGDYGSCADGEGGSGVCSCLKGFVPVGNGTKGRVRRRALQCERNVSNSGEADGFFKMENVKLPDLSEWYEEVVGDSNCRGACLGNCSCKAYAYVTGIGCLIWGNDLVDIRIFSGGVGNEMYLRLAGSELDKKEKLTLIIVIVVSVIILLGCMYLSWRCKRRIKEFIKRLKGQAVASTTQTRKRRGETNLFGTTQIKYEGKVEKGQALPLLTFESVLEATNDFSDMNFLGEGGFGPVYKGMLPGGQVIAAKRLSRSSGQGLKEFKNEVILIAELQHRNLVRLLGCCIQAEEKILIYEYMPNKSLDAFLFDSRKQGLLDWNKRFNIIEGIARGLLYLHRDSRLRIIHRDLKASNILLDEEMNPKISDFGTARIFGRDDNETNTKHVIGTYGYMSPEYAMHGLFSIKSDVYSFGVLLLEIISGKKNSTYQAELSLNFVTYAWKLWNEDNVMDFVDPSIRGSCSRKEISRCICLALLCLQDCATDRPTMSTIMTMLERGTTTLPVPRQPTFASEKKSNVTAESSGSDRRRLLATATASMTMLTGR